MLGDVIASLHMKERPLAEPFHEFTCQTIQATAVLIEEPY